jgi:hypothetical protein
MKVWFIFAISAALFWGAYVPTIGFGQQAFGPKGNANAPMRAFLFIGLAYFVMAVLVPGLWLWTHQLPAAKDAGFNMSGASLSTAAGALGAAGALCVVFALRAARMENPAYMVYVAPVVFAGAPIVNVLISWLVEFFKGEAQAPKPLFLVGLVVSIIGVAIVLLNSPTTHGAPAKPTTTSASAASVPPVPVESHNH